MVVIDQIISRIEQSVDPAAPWLWRIPISSEEWEELHRFVEQHPYDHPLVTMTWVGRWYRDRYYRGCSEWPLPAADAKRLWELSGLDIERFVYLTNTGNHAWQQSIYVLGGLPLKVVSGNREGQMRRLLCNALTGETDDLDTIALSGDSSTALRGSISRRHSLYWYILDVVGGNRQNIDDTEAAFISLMLDANREALSDKFWLEWLVTNRDTASVMTRRLRVQFRPERNLNPDGELNSHHRYLHPLRMVAMGLEATHVITMRLRFMFGKVEIYTQPEPFATWRHTSAEQVFLSWGAETYAMVSDVPQRLFDTVEILARCDDTEEEILVQRFTCQDCLQLFSTGIPGSFTSKRLPQRHSAALFSDRWHVESDVIDVRRKPFSSAEGLTEDWNWAWVNTALTLHNTEGTTLTIRNFATRERPINRLWPELIDYREGGFVDVEIIEEDEDGDEYVAAEKSLPVIFSMSDIGVLTEDATQGTVIEQLPESVEWKNRSGRYTSWQDYTPEFGPLKLRITSASGRTFTTDVLYLPPFDNDTPIIRDPECHEIWYGREEVFVDKLDDMSDTEPLSPSVRVPYHGNGWRCNLPIWRPVKRRELIVDSRLADVPDGNVTMPYIYKQQVKLNEWNDDGFKTLDCNGLPPAGEIFGVSGGDLKIKWSEGAAIMPNTRFPWLKVVIGQKRPTAADSDLTFVYWSMLENEDPKEISPVDPLWSRPGLKFQAGTPADPAMRYRFAVYHIDPRHDLTSASMLEIFKVACRYNAYFFAFPTLTQIREDEVWATITSHLDLSDTNYISALHRFADEMGFDYYKIITPQDI